MRALTKDIVREIKKTKAKFISIAVIMFLGVFVYTGLTETSPTMKHTINNYFEKVNIYDLKITNDFKMTKEDIEYITSNNNVSVYETYYQEKGQLVTDKKELSLYSIPENIGKLKLTEGSMPSADNEIVLADSLIKEYQLGDEVKISYKDKDEKKIERTFKVVGFVYNVDIPENSSNNPEDSNYFAFLTKDNFADFKVAGVNILLKDIDRTDLTADSYYEKVNKVRDEIFDNLISLQQENQTKFITDSNNKITKQQEKIKIAREKIATGKEQLEKTKAFLGTEYDNKLSELKKSENTILKAEEEIANKQKQLTNFKYPRYNVDNVKWNIHYNQFIRSIKSLLSVANIFSIFLFAVALLVSLTTLTRMVDENRINIGTLKSLGYSNLQICKKYFFYGITSALLGGTVGVVSAYYIIVPIIYNAYGRFLIFNKPVIKPSFENISSALIFSIICVCLAVYIPLRNNLKEKTAYLLRPKAPKGAHRIFFEKVPLIWRKLSFLNKVTFRNIFRYKVRMLMTIFGVLGCLSLMFVGFGIRYGVADIFETQLKKIEKYNISVTYNPYISSGNLEKINNLVDKNDIVKSKLGANTNKGTIEKNNEVLDEIKIVTFADESYKDYFTLYNGSENINLTNNGVVINRKLAYLHNLSVGDNINFFVNQQEYSAKIIAINDNHFGHIMYMTKDYSEKLFGKSYEVNSYYIKTAEDKDRLNDLEAELNDIDEVFFVQNNVKIGELLNKQVEGIDIIVAVMVVCSLLLAIVVLYNLINVNVSERIRELSTIKVLGFYANEITRYIFREILYLTIAGIVVGNIVGYHLYKNIILDLTSREAMFASSVALPVYLLSSGITLLITIIVMLIMHRKLKKINMVEALKSVE